MRFPRSRPACGAGLRDRRQRLDNDRLSWRIGAEPWDGKLLGVERSLDSRIVTYADDLVIPCPKGKGEEALQRVREIMGKLKLTVMSWCDAHYVRSRAIAKLGNIRRRLKTRTVGHAYCRTVRYGY